MQISGSQWLVRAKGLLSHCVPHVLKITETNEKKKEAKTNNKKKCQTISTSTTTWPWDGKWESRKLTRRPQGILTSDSHRPEHQETVSVVTDGPWTQPFSRILKEKVPERTAIPASASFYHKMSLLVLGEPDQDKSRTPPLLCPIQPNTSSRQEFGLGPGNECWWFCPVLVTFSAFIYVLQAHDLIHVGLASLLIIAACKKLLRIPCVFSFWVKKIKSITKEPF